MRYVWQSVRALIACILVAILPSSERRGAVHVVSRLICKRKW